MKNKITLILLTFLVSYTFAQPVITSFSPKSGKGGTSVTLSGSGFNATASNNVVRIGGIKCNITSASSSSLTVELPSQITTDYFYVTDVANSKIGKSFHRFLSQTDSTNWVLSSTSYGSKISLAAGATAGNINAGFGFADIDDDGDFDIALFENTSSSLLYLSNNWTSGAFSSSSFSSTTLKSSAFANTSSTATLLMDVDSDGDLDFYCARSGSTSEYHKVYENTTTTSVSINTTATDITGMGSYGSHPRMADFNRDGLMDHVSATSWWAHVSENLGTSSPSFTYYNLFNSSLGSTMYTTPLDINSDGVFDVAIGGSTTTNGFKWAVNNTSANASAANYSFSSISYLATPQANSNLWEGDFNNDGKMDVLTFRNNSATIFQNNSTSTSSYGFATGSNLNIGGLSFYTVHFADLDNDGLLDIIAGTSGTYGNAVHFFKNTTSGGTISFGTAVKLIDGMSSVLHQIEVVDFNLDGFWDIIAKSSTATTIDIYLNLANKIPTYYVKSTGVSALATLSNWCSNYDGTGTVPASFSVNAIFTLANSSNSTNFSLGSSNLTFSGTKLVIPSGATLTVPTSRTLTLTGCTLDNSGTIGGNTGSILVNGTGNITFDGTINTGTFTTSTASDVTIGSSATMTINTALNLTQVGTFKTNNNVTLKSGNIKTTYMGPVSGNISGNINCELYIAGGYRKYRFLSHPFSTNQSLSLLTDDFDVTGSGGSSNGFTSTGSNNPSAFWYNTTNGDGGTYDLGWTGFTSANGGSGNNWAPGQGIRALIRGAKTEGLDGNTYTPSAITIDMAGPVNTGNFTVNLDYLGSGNSLGLNLLGNPYPCPVDISGLVFNSATSNNINKTVYWRNARTGSYQTDVISSGTAYPIRAFSAFFLKTSAAASSVTFTESLKQTSSSMSTFLGLGELQTPNFLRISALIKSEQFDKVDFYFGNQYSDSLDQKFDAFKLTNDYFNFYSITSNKLKAAIDFRNLDTTKLIPLGLGIAKNAIDTIQLTFDANNTGVTLYLYDYLTQVKTPIVSGNNYSIVVNANSPETVGDNRLVIGTIIALEKLSTKLKNELCLSIYPNPTKDVLNIQTINYTRTAVVKLYNMSGSEVINTNIDFSENRVGTINTKNLQSGIYLLEVISENGLKFNSKIVK